MMFIQSIFNIIKDIFVSLPTIPNMILSIITALSTPRQTCTPVTHLQHQDRG